MERKKCENSDRRENENLIDDSTKFLHPKRLKQKIELEDIEHVSNIETSKRKHEKMLWRASRKPLE